VAALGASTASIAHAKLITTAVERGRALALPSVVCTFDPPPASVLWPERAPLPIATLEDNLGRMNGLGADAALVIPFTLGFSRMEAEPFVAEVLAGTLGAREIIVGYNHTFGHDARGTAALLTELGPQHGFAARVLPPAQVARADRVIERDPRAAPGRRRGPCEGCSATRTPSPAPSCAGGAGRTLGFPTANLRPDRPLALAPGVYVARATWAGGGDGGAADAVVNVGYRPTFGENQYWVEAYLLDFSGDLYDRTLRLEFRDRIRPEMKFSGVDALKRQVTADVEAARVRRGGHAASS
jgi:riboflavin kinase/FMN adenylyltransferase